MRRKANQMIWKKLKQDVKDFFSTFKSKPTYNAQDIADGAERNPHTVEEVQQVKTLPLIAKIEKLRTKIIKRKTKKKIK
jgi:hypothetical protein